MLVHGMIQNKKLDSKCILQWKSHVIHSKWIILYLHVHDWLVYFSPALSIGPIHSPLTLTKTMKKTYNAYHTKDEKGVYTASNSNLTDSKMTCGCVQFEPYQQVQYYEVTFSSFIILGHYSQVQHNQSSHGYWFRPSSSRLEEIGTRRLV